MRWRRQAIEGDLIPTMTFTRRGDPWYKNVLLFPPHAAVGKKSVSVADLAGLVLNCYILEEDFETARTEKRGSEEIPRTFTSHYGLFTIQIR